MGLKSIQTLNSDYCSRQVVSMCELGVIFVIFLFDDSSSATAIASKT